MPEAESGPPRARRPDAPLTQAEAAEFARAMNVRVGAIRSAYAVQDDESALENYDQLVADPVKDFFAARNYEFFVRLKTDLVEAAARRCFGPGASSRLRVLDIGCGTGVMLRVLSGIFPDAWACDPSQAMVSRAGERAVVMPDPARMPFDDASFDIALSACVYHHIPQELHARHMVDVRRILRPGGLFMVFEHNPYNPLTRMIVRRCPLDESAELLPAREVRTRMRAAGFTNVRTRYYMFLPQAVYSWARALEAVFSVTALGGQYCTMGRR